MPMINGKMFKPFTYGFKINHPTAPLNAFDMQIIFYVLSLMFSGKNLRCEDHLLDARICLEQETYTIRVFNRDLIEYTGMLLTRDNSKTLLETLEKLEHLFFVYQKGFSSTNAKVIDTIEYGKERILQDLEQSEEEDYTFEIAFVFKCKTLDLFVEKDHGQH